jgi:hypothetical protein
MLRDRVLRNPFRALTCTAANAVRCSVAENLAERGENTICRNAAPFQHKSTAILEENIVEDG